MINTINSLTTTIIIVTYNPSVDFFKQYLSFSDCQFIIVDNSDSLDISIANNLSQLSNVILIQNHENLGIAKALNIGCKKAIELSYDYVITMDQDSEINKKIINSLVNFYQKNKFSKDIAVVSPLHIIQGGVVANTQANIKSKEFVNTIFTMTSGNLVVLEKWFKLNGFDEKLFIDMVDLDFYVRCMLANYMVLTLPSVIMHHCLGDSESHYILGKRIDVSNHSALRKYYQTRNMLWFVKQYFFKYPKSRYLLKVLRNMLFGVIFYEKDKLKKLKFMLLGLKDLLFNNFGKLQY